MAETKKGKLRGQRGKYYLEVEGQQVPLPFTLPEDEKTLQQLVGQDVEVFYSKPTVVAFRPVEIEVQEALKHIIFTCYVPRDEFKISRSLAVENLQQWAQDAVKQGALTEEFADQLMRPTAK
jgi:hypothetical protein